MKENKTDKNIAYTPDPGEEELAKLIKEAGETVRARKKSNGATSSRILKDGMWSCVIFGMLNVGKWIL